MSRSLDAGAHLDGRRSSRDWGLAVPFTSSDLLRRLERRPAAQITLLVLIAAALRLPGLATTPEIVADEGLWTISAKNFVKFGDWFMDGHQHMLLSPTFHLLALLAFETLEPSILAARLLSASLAIASVALLYAVVWRISRRPDLAVVTALLFATNEWLVVQSRYALIEPTELAFALTAALLMTFPSATMASLAGLAMGLAILSKINILFLLPFIASVTATPDGCRSFRRHAVRAVLFTAVALGVAGLGYGHLYRTYPEQFVAAFRYELDGVHFESLSSPIVRLGRFGIDPVQIGRTILELLRASPLLLVFAAIGLVTLPAARPRGALWFASWAIAGSAFFLCQMFQPIRYFYLVFPAYAFLAGIAMTALSAEVRAASPDRRRLTVPLVLLYLAYSGAYLTMNALANRGTMLETVTTWARRHTRPTDVILAAGYLCTDLENRAYAYYRYARTPQQLEESIRRLGVKYVIYDRREWRPELGRYLAARFPVVARWSFGAVYDVSERGSVGLR